MHACDKAESKTSAHFSYFTEKIKIKDQFLVSTGTQVIQEFINEEEEAVVWVAFVEGRHHLLECPLIIRELARIRTIIRQKEQA